MLRVGNTENEIIAIYNSLQGKPFDTKDISESDIRKVWSNQKNRLILKFEKAKN